MSGRHIDRPHKVAFHREVVDARRVLDQIARGSNRQRAEAHQVQRAIGHNEYM